jgi:hypothetical protein
LFHKNNIYLLPVNGSKNKSKMDTSGPFKMSSWRIMNTLRCGHFWINDDNLWRKFHFNRWFKRSASSKALILDLLLLYTSNNYEVTISIVDSDAEKKKKSDPYILQVNLLDIFPRICTTTISKRKWICKKI